MEGRRARWVLRIPAGGPKRVLRAPVRGPPKRVLRAVVYVPCRRLIITLSTVPLISSRSPHFLVYYTFDTGFPLTVREGFLSLPMMGVSLPILGVSSDDGKVSPDDKSLSLDDVSFLMGVFPGDGVPFDDGVSLLMMRCVPPDDEVSLPMIGCPS